MVNSHFTTLVECGFTKPSARITFGDKSEIVQAVALHHVILRSKAELDQFCDGLALCGVLQAIKCHSSLTRNYFTIDGFQQLTSGIKHM